jgi:hypothetical protein
MKNGLVFVKGPETSGLYTLWRVHTIRKEAHNVNPLLKDAEYVTNQIYNCGCCLEQEGTKPLWWPGFSKKISFSQLRFHYV